MRPSHTCLGCGFDLAGVRVRMLPGLPVRGMECPRCGRAAARRLQGKPVVRLGAMATGALLFQVLLGAGLLAMSTASLWWVAQDVRRLPGCDHLHDLALQRDPVTGYPLLLTWLSGSWAFALVPPLLTGLWVTLGLSHWRRRWARIPAWVSAQAGLLLVGWSWPVAEAWWSGSAPPYLPAEPLLSACLWALLGAGIMSVWLPVERALLKILQADSILTELVQRRIWKRKKRHA